MSNCTMIPVFLCSTDIRGVATAAVIADARARVPESEMTDAEIADLLDFAVDQRVRKLERVCAEQSDRVCVPPRTKYVTAYAITQQYGGPEEGGWWWNCWEALETVQVSDNPTEIESAKRALERAHVAPTGFEERGFWGENDYECVLVEEEPRQHQTRERPYYC